MPYQPQGQSPLELALGARLGQGATVEVVLDVDAWARVRGADADGAGLPDAEPTGSGGVESRSGDRAESVCSESMDARESVLAEFRTLQAEADRELAAIEELELAKARLEGQLIDAYAALHSTLGQAYGARTEGARSSVPVSVDAVVGQEIALATGVGPGEVSRRLSLATGGRRHAVAREALRAGRIGLYRALQIVSECREVPDQVQPDLESQLLTGLRDSDGDACSQRAFSSRLRRLVRGVDQWGQAERRRMAAARRCAYGRIGPDGMGSLTLVATAERIAAALARADAFARAARAAGDSRTLDQLRSDFMSDALLFGWPTGSDGSEAGQRGCSDSPDPDSPGPDSPGPDSPFLDPEETSPDGLCAECVGRDHSGSGEPGGVGVASDRSHPASGDGAPADGGAPAGDGAPADGDAPAGNGAPRGDDAPAAGGTPPEDGDPPGPGLWVGRPPPARVWIVVPFEVAAGLSDAPCELPGHGWVTAEHAREIITAPGSLWQQLSVDVDSGYALRLESRGYQPSAELVAQVRARDGVCRGPGCQVLAERSDFDHEIPWPAGATSYVNAYAKHRFCHMSKTARLWLSEPTSEHGLKWTTLTGREYLTYPKDWLAGLAEYEEQQCRAARQPAEGSGAGYGADNAAGDNAAGEDSDDLERPADPWGRNDDRPSF